MSQTTKSSRSGPSPLTIASQPMRTERCAITDHRSGSAPPMMRRPPSPRIAVIAFPFDAAPPPSLETTDTPSVMSPVMRRPVRGHD